MGRFSKLLEGKGKDVKLGDEVFNIKPLKSKYLGLFMDTNKEKQAEATFALVTQSLRQTDENITKEDVEEIPIAEFNKIMDTILEVNELKK